MGLTITPVHNRLYLTSKSRRYKIHICVNIDRIRNYYEVPTPYNIHEDDWTGKQNTWVANTEPCAFEINEAIGNKCSQIQDIARRFYHQHRKLTFHHLNKELGFKGNRQIFNDYFKEYMKNPPPTVVITPSPGKNIAPLSCTSITSTPNFASMKLMWIW